MSELKPCPLEGGWHLGRYRADGKVLCNGTIRIMSPSFDTHPSEEFQHDILCWIVDALNSKSREQALIDELKVARANYSLFHKEAAPLTHRSISISNAINKINKLIGEK